MGARTPTVFDSAQHNNVELTSAVYGEKLWYKPTIDIRDDDDDDDIVITIIIIVIMRYGLNKGDAFRGRLADTEKNK